MAARGIANSPDLPKVAGIILAAGLSSRMGRIKALLPMGDGVLLDRVLDAARASSLHSLIVVLGHGADEILAGAALGDALVVRNPDYRKGQSTSLHAGIGAVPPDCDGAMFLLGDQPFISPGTIDTLLGKMTDRGQRILLPTFGGVRGNPALIHRSVFPEILEIEGDTGGRALFRRMADAILEVPVPDSGIHLDLDTEADYRRLVVDGTIPDGETRREKR